jgi:large subunit ribosomal protein L9
MEVILLRDVDKVGGKHEVVSVKNGYGRNYLIPQKMAIIANTTNRKRLADLVRQEDSKQAKFVGAAQELAEKLKGKVLRIGAKAGTSGKIFGSVTTLQLENALKEQFQVNVDRKRIDLPDEVKELGTYKMKLNLHPEIIVEMDFEVAAD